MESSPNGTEADSSWHHGRPKLPNPYIAPRTETERSVAAIWQELFGVDSIGVHDNFFELGGHSLMAVHLVPKLRERFGADLSVADFLRLATVDKLATHIDAVRWVADAGQKPSGRDGQHRDEIDL
jgi:acyl carrier protein